MKKYFFLLLSVVLFAACGNDNEPTPDVPGGETGKRPEKVAEYDLTDLLAADAATIAKKLGTPEMDLGFIKMYSFEKGAVVEATAMFNNSTNMLYTISARLRAGSYTIQQVQDYFAQWLTKFEDDDEGTVVYLDNEDPDKATIQVYFWEDTNEETGETSVYISFTNPQNAPEMGEGGELLEMSAIELVSTFMGADIEEVLEDYPAFEELIPGVYCADVDDALVSSVYLTVEEGKVVAIQLSYENAEDEDSIFDYYRANGYEVGEPETVTDEEEGYSYTVNTFNGQGYTINYADYMATISLEQ